MEENNENKENNVFSQVPAKVGFWNSFKNFWLQPIVIELTPYQRKVFKEVHDFWNQEVYIENGEVHLRKASYADEKTEDAEEPEVDVSL